MKIKKILAALAAMTMMAVTLTACGGSDKSESEASRTKSEDDVKISADSAINEGDPDISGQTIKWLSYYDVNPTGNDDRSIALTLFEDVYGGKVEWISTTYETKYDDLANRLLSGDPVDMFPYEWDAVPNGVYKNQYQPLDDYIDLDDELWADVKGLADKMEYKGAHYVIPYCISDPVCIMYSRQMMEDEGLDDPYELYQKGEWDWDAFMSMMKSFVNNADDGETRFGCTGWFGPAIVQSTGQTIVNYDGTKFTNNIMSPEIEKAELILEEIANTNLYDTAWHSYFPDDGSCLFYGMAPWALSESNGKNPDADIFLVPFPKMPGSDEYYLCCSFGAKMLVANSDKGDAVAAYIKCERIAASDDQYTAAAREKALIPTVNASGEKTKYITEEQWDMWQSVIDPANVTPVFDFGNGMGTRMTDETYDYNTRGVMKNLTDALITKYEGSPSTWAELRDAWKAVIDEEIVKYN